MLVQSAMKLLNQLDRELIPQIEEIQQCFASADQAIGGALRV